MEFIQMLCVISADLEQEHTQTHAHIHTHTLSLSLSLSLTHTHTRTHTHTHTHAHTRTLLRPRGCRNNKGGRGKRNAVKTTVFIKELDLTSSPKGQRNSQSGRSESFSTGHGSSSYKGHGYTCAPGCVCVA